VNADEAHASARPAPGTGGATLHLRGVGPPGPPGPLSPSPSSSGTFRWPAPSA